MRDVSLTVSKSVICSMPRDWCCLPIDLDNTGSRIEWHQVKPAEMTNLEYQDGGQSAFSINK